MNKTVHDSVQYLKGIGPQRAKVLANAGIATIDDLLYYFPRRYEDRTHFCRIAEVKEGQVCTIRADVLAKGLRSSFRRKGFSIIEIAVSDETGLLRCIWFNQGYLKKYFLPGQTFILYGKVGRYGKGLQMSNPEFELVDKKEESLNMGRIIPVYSLPKGISQRVLRRSIKQALEEYLPEVADILPYDVRARNNLLNLARSLINIHFPENLELQKQAYTRLAFEEFFLFQLPLVIRKIKRQEKTGICHKGESRLADEFIARLSFRLTGGQQQAIAEIIQDMSRPQVMQRLLQGDVGSGKTVVATIASLIAIQGGYQVVFMVPTEILARQHYEKIMSQVSSLKFHDRSLCIKLLTGSTDSQEKKAVIEEIRRGSVDLVIGTHALLEQQVGFKQLGLVVIDEQHKFGVGQRALLPQKGLHPDVLIMTATPIPRTLAITLYGDLDVSVIHELPPGRPKIQTLHFTCDQEDKAYAIARGQLQQGNQVFIVSPVIEESYALDIAGAKKIYEALKSGALKEFRLGLIHGRLKQKEQDQIMQKFKQKQIDALVSTTVLEVGIDIPNATCMIIQHAQRFGLSQLHQLRGRIGRGTSESFCLLVSDADSEDAAARLQAMVEYSDGFRIAEEDLKIRGAGEFFGSRQHGLTELKIGDPLTQMQLLKRARQEVVRLLQSDLQLKDRSHVLLKERLVHRFPEFEKVMAVG